MPQVVPVALKVQRILPERGVAVKKIIFFSALAFTVWSLPVLVPGQTLNIDYSTYLGGTAYETGYAIVVDSTGAAYSIGHTYSSEFPPANAYQGSYAGNTDGFVTKLGSTGSGIIYSTYLGGTGSDKGYGIALDNDGSVLLTGSTYSTNFPVVNSYQGSNAGSQEAFVSRLNSSGSDLIYSTYLGGSNADVGYGITVDSSGAAYVSGDSASTNFPVKDAYQSTLAGSYDAFVTKLTSSGSGVLFSTYLGGSGTDEAWRNGVSLDSLGAIYMTGRTQSTDFPVANAYQSTNAGSSDAFVTKFNSSTDIAYSTYLGGTGTECGRGIMVGADGSAYLSGETSSANFPVANAYQSSNAGSSDAFLSRLTTSGSALVYSTYLGGSSNDYCHGLTVDSVGAAHIFGETVSSNFPIVNAYQGILGGNADCFVSKFTPEGSTLTYSSYLGGSGNDDIHGGITDSGNSIYLTGHTESTNFPTKNAYQAIIGGEHDSFITKLTFIVTATPTPTPPPIPTPTPPPTPRPTPTSLMTPPPTPFPTPTPPPTPVPSLTPIPTPSPICDLFSAYLVYSTYLGGYSEDRASGIAVDGDGCAYLAGSTVSSGFPGENAYQPVYGGGNYDVFVGKLSSSGSVLLYATFLGGDGTDQGNGVAVDSIGCAYVTGRTYSEDFPTRNAYQPSLVVSCDADDPFLCKLSSSGSSIIYSTYLGGGSHGWADAVAVDSQLCAYITGAVGGGAPVFPTVNAYQPYNGGDADAFVSKFSSSGTTLVYSTFLGGNPDDYGYGIAVDSNSSAYVCGMTKSTNFPIKNAYQSAKEYHEDTFVAKLSPSGSALDFSTFFGGNGNEKARGIALDGDGSVYITGATGSTDFPVINPYQATHDSAGWDVFVSKFSLSGSLLYSTYLGGSSSDTGRGIAVDAEGSACVVGDTSSSGFPLLNPYQVNQPGGYDVFVTRLSSSGSSLLYSTWLGGDGHEFGIGVGLDDNGGVYVTGYSWDSSFPMVNAYQSTNAGDMDAFAAKLQMDCYQITPAPSSTPSPSPSSTPPTTTPTPSPSPVVPTPSRTPGLPTTPIPTPPPSPSPTPTAVPAAPQISAVADPTFGCLPLTVNFNATVIGGSEIQVYRWDFENDHVWDYVSTQSPHTTRTYDTEGTFLAVCQVIDSLGRHAYDFAIIEVYPPAQAPTVVASAVPDLCQAPCEVTLGGIATAEGEILYYLWDFEDDGVVDWGSPETAVTSHIYGRAGSYDAKLKVIDDLGAAAEDVVSITIQPAAAYPQAQAAASPTSGDVPLTVNFSGIGTPSGEIVLYEWDFDGDGDFDWSSQSDGNCSRVFAAVGNYEANFQVTNTDNLTATEIVSISVTTPSQLKVWISVPKDGDIVSGNSVSIRANTAPGNFTKWVQPQYRATAETEWNDLTSPIYPPPYSFACAWDTSALSEGNYDIRARASDTSDQFVYSEVITVTVNHSDSDIEESDNPSGDHIKSQKISRLVSSGVEISGGSSASVILGALDNDDTLLLTDLSANPRLGRAGSNWLFGFCRFELESGGELNKPCTLRIPYGDDDDDGIVDGTATAENELIIWFYDSDLGDWQPTLGSIVYAAENFVESRLLETGEYALGSSAIPPPAPTPMPTATTTPTPIPSPTPAITPTVVPTPSTMPTVTATPKTVPTAQPTGTPTVPAPAWIHDYNGDGTSEIAIYREISGLWAIQGVTRVYFGSSIDEPVPGDYDGDGTTEIGIYRWTTGLWAIRSTTRAYFGSGSDLPVPGDFSGDGTSDIGIFRDTSGLWAIRGVTRVYFGSSLDSPASGYYNEDSTKDIGIFRGSSGLWAIRGISRVYFGSSPDTIIPGDYDGDRAWDYGIFRHSSGRWAIRGVTRSYLGNSMDEPVPADYNGDSRDDIGIFRDSSGLWAIRGISRVYFGATGDVPVTR
jgi:PKD repeat protein